MLNISPAQERLKQYLIESIMHAIARIENSHNQTLRILHPDLDHEINSALAANNIAHLGHVLERLNEVL